MWRLKIGGKLTGYTVRPDEKYPDVMWRVHAPDGQVSDMVNLSRAKDAALTMATRRARNERNDHSMLGFKWEYGETATGARPGA